ncbi:MAG: bifunctional metallophosphatase/5'-nucleotidase [Armatimonadota bacterium]
MKNRLNVYLLAILLVFSFTSCSITNASDLPAYTDIIILHTNDAHGHLLPFEYKGDHGVGGISRRSAMIDLIRNANSSNVLLLEAGDVFTRGPVAQLYKGEPDIECMNEISYDAMTLGNNEFKGDEGLAGQKNMMDRIKQAKFPVVCANVVTKDNQPIVPPYVILNRKGLRIGIFGLTAPRVQSYPQAEGLQILDPISVSRKMVDELKGKSDVIIALTHIGYDLDKQLASAVPDIDIIVGGDSHTWLYKPEVIKQADTEFPFWIGGPLIVQDGEWGRCLGRLRVILRKQGDHDYQVMSYDGELLPVNPSIKSDEAIEKILEPYLRPLKTELAECIETIPITESARWMAQVYREIGKTDIGIADNYVESGIYKGTVTDYDLRAVYSFNNSLYTTSVSGKVLSDLISNKSVSFAGLTVSGNNIISAGNKVFDLDSQYTICLDDYLLGVLGLNVNECRPLNKYVHDSLVEYVKNKKIIGKLN